MNKLTDKQEIFCQEYLIDLNATQAAIRAGYTDKAAKEVGYENLTKPHIQNRIATLMKERAARLEIDADYALQGAVEIFEIAMGRKPTKLVLKDSIGNGMTETKEYEFYKTDLSAAARALEIIGRHRDIRAFESDEQDRDTGSAVAVPVVYFVKDERELN